MIDSWGIISFNNCFKAYPTLKILRLDSEVAEDKTNVGRDDWGLHVTARLVDQLCHGLL